MSSETTLVATQLRLRQWAEQIRDCNNRPEGMKVSEWCAQHDITTANYYYRMRRLSNGVTIFQMNIFFIYDHSFFVDLHCSFSI